VTSRTAVKIVRQARNKWIGVVIGVFLGMLVLSIFGLPIDLTILLGAIVLVVCLIITTLTTVRDYKKSKRL
jgi:uncharacterized membrane protein YgaE (UPF0421/DUF939 family)